MSRAKWRPRAERWEPPMTRAATRAADALAAAFVRDALGRKPTPDEFPGPDHGKNDGEAHPVSVFDPYTDECLSDGLGDAATVAAARGIRTPMKRPAKALPVLRRDEYNRLRDKQLKALSRKEFGPVPAARFSLDWSDSTADEAIGSSDRAPAGPNRPALPARAPWRSEQDRDSAVAAALVAASISTAAGSRKLTERCSHDGCGPVYVHKVKRYGRTFLDLGRQCYDYLLDPAHAGQLPPQTLVYWHQRHRDEDSAEAA